MLHQGRTCCCTEFHLLRYRRWHTKQAFALVVLLVMVAQCRSLSFLNLSRVCTIPKTRADQDVSCQQSAQTRGMSAFSCLWYSHFGFNDNHSLLSVQWNELMSLFDLDPRCGHSRVFWFASKYPTGLQSDWSGC